MCTALGATKLHAETRTYTCDDCPLPIPATQIPPQTQGNMQPSVIEIFETGCTISDVRVRVVIDHTARGDLDIWLRHDRMPFGPALGDLDLHLFSEGRQLQSHQRHIRRCRRYQRRHQLHVLRRLRLLRQQRPTR